MKAISLVMPAYNALSTLPRVLPPLRDALASGAISEFIVVDDNSTDAGPKMCREYGATVLRTPHRSGPAGARNLGVEHATGEIILFIDADVVMDPKVPSIVQELFATEERLGAAFGSYDDKPAAPNFVSQYLNLRHHFIHQHGPEEANTFWAGCGAVDRLAFLKVAGFDTKRFMDPSIEDVELGNRIRKAGLRIRLHKGMLCKHLKHWTLGNMVHTDIFRRAKPWARMMHSPGYESHELNVSWTERRRALLAGLFWLSLGFAVVNPMGLWFTGGLLALAFLANVEFFGLVRRSAGIPHMLAAVLLHQLYYAYSSAVYVYCGLEARLKPNRQSLLAEPE